MLLVSSFECGDGEFAAVGKACGCEEFADVGACRCFGDVEFFSDGFVGFGFDDEVKDCAQIAWQVLDCVDEILVFFLVRLGFYVGFRKYLRGAGANDIHT